MAYVFNALQKQIDEEDQGKQDIFAQEAQGGFGLTAQTESQQTGLGSGDQPKTTTGLSLTGAAPSTGGATTPAASVEVAEPRGATEQRQQTLDTQRTQFPQGLESLGASLTEKEQSLAPAKESYLQQYRQKDYGLAPDVASAAVGGDIDAMGKVSGLLGRTTPGVIGEAFEAPETVTPTIGQIQTEGGLEQYLRRQGGPQYSSGEGAFDVASLTRDPLFQAGRAELARREAALGQQARGLESSLPGEARDILSANLAGSQTGLRGQLGGYATDIEQAIAEAQAIRQADLERTRAGQANLARAHGTRSAQELAGRTPDELGLDDLLTGGGLGVDPGRFFDVRQDPITAGEVTTADQAGRFNRIQDLLGTGGTGIESLTGADFSSFDQQAYEQALQQAGMTERDRVAAEIKQEEIQKQIDEDEDKRQREIADRPANPLMPGDTGPVQAGDSGLLKTVNIAPEGGGFQPLDGALTPLPPHVFQTMTGIGQTPPPPGTGPLTRTDLPPANIAPEGGGFQPLEGALAPLTPEEFAAASAPSGVPIGSADSLQSQVDDFYNLPVSPNIGPVSGIEFPDLSGNIPLPGFEGSQMQRVQEYLDRQAAGLPPPSAPAAPAPGTLNIPPPAPAPPPILAAPAPVSTAAPRVGGLALPTAPPPAPYAPPPVTNYGFPAINDAVSPRFGGSDITFADGASFPNWDQIF